MRGTKSRPNTCSRRIFLTAGNEHFQLLSFTQRPDGSIYISAPDLATCRWLDILPGNPPQLQISTIPSAGKLSVHGSGVTHVRCLDSGDVELRLVGNHLMRKDKQSLGLRHLVTAFFSRPTHVPASVANSRLSDYSILVQEQKPYVIIFWAVPSTRKLNVNVHTSFHANDLEKVPPESGFGGFGLRTHTVVWFAYRTKHMARWPAEPHLCFHDGFYAPVLIGTGEGEFRLELRTPKYQLSGDELYIVV